MKLFEFFRKRESQMKNESLPIQLNSEDNVFDSIQQEFIGKATSNAEKIVRAFNSKYDGAFDYSITSLSVLDHLTEDFADFADLSDEEMIADFCEQAGSYILEVARRNYGGTYFWEDELQQPLLKTGLPDFEITLLTFGKVKARIVYGESNNIPDFFKKYTNKLTSAQKGDLMTFK